MSGATPDEKFVDQIYEAAVLPDLWPAVLDRLNAIGNGHFAALFSFSRDDWRWIASEYGVRISQEYIAEGWPQRTDRLQRLFAAQHPGFLGDLDVYTLEEMDNEPVFTEFHRPRGLGWGTATAIPVPTGDTFVFDVERRFETGPVDRATIERLDGLRPHLARAALLSARLSFERARAAAIALEHLGLAAGLLGRKQQLIAANVMLMELMPAVLYDRQSRLACTDLKADVLLAQSLFQSASWGEARVRSVPIGATDDRPPMIAHLIPVRRAANDVFPSASDILVVTPVLPTEVPAARILQGLFDLTPAEARVARGIAANQTLDKLAVTLGVSRETVRSQLKSVLAKTGTTRQVELAALLAAVHTPRSG